MSISDDSRLNFSTRIRLVDESGNLLENERIDIPIPRGPIIRTSRQDLQEYTSRDGDTWSNISARLLRGRSDLWWAIAEFSGVIDPFAELFTGAKLRIPPFDTVMFDTLSFNLKPTALPTGPDEDH